LRKLKEKSLGAFECIGVIGGVRMKLHVFCFDLPQSDACFIKAYPAEITEAFLDGHVSAFAFFGGVPISILYDRDGADSRRRHTPAHPRLHRIRQPLSVRGSV
jgi:transposase